MSIYSSFENVIDPRWDQQKGRAERKDSITNLSATSAPQTAPYIYQHFNDQYFRAVIGAVHSRFGQPQSDKVINESDGFRLRYVQLHQLRPPTPCLLPEDGERGCQVEMRDAFFK